MSKTQNTLTDVARILRWNKVDVNHYEADVQYRDGTHHRYDRLTQDGWDIIKDAEQRADLDEANAPTAKIVVDREPVCCDECVGKPDANDQCSRCERCLHQCDCTVDAPVIEAVKKVDAQIDQQLAYYRANPNTFGLCAWCRHFWSRISGNRCFPMLDPKQFEATRHDGASHGCCPTCRAGMLADARKLDPTYPVGTPIKVVGVRGDVAGGYGDDRNEGRLGVIARVIVAFGELDDHEDIADDVLYEVKFVDGELHDEPHWMDIESGLTNGNSAHFHSEMERL